ncbi:hypothetical protein JKA74_08605 [Marivirga sp. S37H4]|uniref:Uncharacterized protein n=1 Tax=Marivirga aurantiaca TaxID=2802615 RepID=A0A934WYE7_9BACT|nr:hypothetical protein [Marivirga aurantiaca]MBK6265096.1 hypothetical protein [Marivirga aurantiaca]
MKYLVLLILLSHACFGQVNLEPNSIGLAYIAGYEETGDGYNALIDISIPQDYLINDNRTLHGKTFQQNVNIKIFDVSRSYLLLDTTANFEFKMEFWCENDGGTQYRPSAHLKVDNRQILGDYIVNYELQDLLGFAVIDLSEQIKPATKGQIEPKIALSINSKDEPSAYVWTDYDDAENCDGKPENNLIVFLKPLKVISS